MNFHKIIVLTAIALIAFAANSVLCRLALANTNIDPSSFTAIRMTSAALCLLFICLIQGKIALITKVGGYRSAVCLFTYAILFSFSYKELATATGALLLFAAVQFTMLILAAIKGDRFSFKQWLGFALAVFGILYLFLPQASPPPLMFGSMMIGAGIAWGAYSLLGKQAGDPTVVSAANFLRTLPMMLVCLIIFADELVWHPLGMFYALLSGIFASGMGYAVWYAMLPHIRASSAASLQLSVPVIASVGGLILLDEAITWALLCASVMILGGIALIITKARPASR